MTLPEKAHKSIKKQKRTAEEIRKEVIETLTKGEYTITQLMLQANMNYRGTKKLLKELIDDGIVQTRDKRARLGWNRMFTHYQVAYQEVYDN